MIHSSAPGKLMLFGEHTVVYGNPCIATSINKRLDVYLNDKNENGNDIKDTIIDALGIKAKFPSDFEQHKFLNLTIGKFLTYTRFVRVFSNRRDLKIAQRAFV